MNKNSVGLMTVVLAVLTVGGVAGAVGFAIAVVAVGAVGGLVAGILVARGGVGDAVNSLDRDAGMSAVEELGARQKRDRRGRGVYDEDDQPVMVQRSTGGYLVAVGVAAVKAAWFRYRLVTVAVVVAIAAIAASAAVNAPAVTGARTALLVAVGVAVGVALLEFLARTQQSE